MDINKEIERLEGLKSRTKTSVWLSSQMRLNLERAYAVKDERIRTIKIVEEFWENNKVKRIGEVKEYIPNELKGFVSSGVKSYKLQYKTFNDKTLNELNSQIADNKSLGGKDE